MDTSNAQIEALEKKMDRLQRSIDSVRKIFLWTLMISLALFMLPLIGLIFVVPRFLATYMSLLQ